MERLASLEHSVQSSQSVSTDPRVVVRAPGAYLHPSELMLERYPYIQEDFFQRSLTESERRRFVFECPKNVLREYDPPKLNKVPISGTGKRMHNQLSQLQYRLSGLTRPLGWFIYK